MTEERFRRMGYDETDGEARRLADRVLKVSADGIGGPFNLLLKVPGTGARIVDLLDHFNGGHSLLPPRIRRLAQLTLSREARARYAWWTHRTRALKAGEFTAAELDVLNDQRCPDSFDPTLRAVHAYVRALSQGTPTPLPVLKAMKTALGEEVTADLLLLCGTYNIVAMILNEADVPLPEGEEDTLR